MKVVYLNPSAQMGGAEWSLVNLLSGLREQPDFNGYVVVPEAGPLTARCEQLGIQTEILPFPEVLAGLGDSGDSRAVHSRAGTLYNLLRSVRPVFGYTERLRRLLRRERPDAIHTNGLKMHLAGAWAHGREGQLKRVPLVGHIHDYVSARPLAGNALRATVGQFSRFIANSQSVAADIQRFLKTKKVEAVYNAIDMARFSPEGGVMDLDRTCGLDNAPPNTVRIGLVATFARWKGHLTFLEALARVDKSLPVRGYIVGGPIYRTTGSQFSLKELKTEVNRLNLSGRVGFTGFIEDSAMAVRALDVVVHASTKPEPFGMAIVEAMACGKAVIVSDQGGARELFEENRTAVGHRPGDVGQLSEKMSELSKDRPFREKLGKQAYTAVHSRFGKADMASSFRRVYESVISEARISAS